MSFALVHTERCSVQTAPRASPWCRGAPEGRRDQYVSLPAQRAGLPRMMGMTNIRRAFSGLDKGRSL